MLNRILLFVLLNLLASQLSAQGINFSASAELTASHVDLTGRVSLTLNADQPVHDTLVYARAQGERQPVLEAGYWEPGTQQVFELEQQSAHHFPGVYHLLLEVAFRDQSGANLAIAMQLQYHVGEEVAPESEPKLLVIDSDRLKWHPEATQVADVRLALTTAPSWAAPRFFTPPDTHIELAPNGDRAAFPNWHYPQFARLEWVKDSRHYSRMFNWTIYTDADGNWKRSSEPARPARWRTRSFLFTISLLLVLAAGFALWRKTRNT